MLPMVTATTRFNQAYFSDAVSKSGVVRK